MMTKKHTKFEKDSLKDGWEKLRTKPDRRTDGRTDRVIPVYPPQLVGGWYNDKPLYPPSTASRRGNPKKQIKPTLLELKSANFPITPQRIWVIFQTKNVEKGDKSKVTGARGKGQSHQTLSVGDFLFITLAFNRIGDITIRMIKHVAEKARPYKPRDEQGSWQRSKGPL